MLDQCFPRHHIIPSGILELGTFLGTSTRVFSDAFKDAKIVTIDIMDRKIDFESRGNIETLVGSQTDEKLLSQTISTSFKNGVDLIIDDASHIGVLSKISFDILFPLLNSGGAYFIEDWGTGYWDESVDGSRFQSFPLFAVEGCIPKRLPSHDFGMVGFVKSLVDYTHESAIRRSHASEVRHASRISSLEFSEGVCMLVKA